MPKGDLFTIGEFSAITGVGIYSLRYYDEIGALKPEYVDPVSNYRYYGYKQLSRIPAISICKDAGIKLSEFDSFLVDGAVNYKKLIDESRRSVENKIESYRAKQTEFDQIERFCEIRQSLADRAEVTAEIGSMDVWTVPYGCCGKGNSSDILMKLSESAASAGIRLMPSVYGLLRTNVDGSTVYAFSQVCDEERPAQYTSGCMTIEGASYIFSAADAGSISDAAAVLNDSSLDMIVSLDLLSGGASGPRYCSVRRLNC